MDRRLSNKLPGQLVDVQRPCQLHYCAAGKSAWEKLFRNEFWWFEDPGQLVELIRLMRERMSNPFLTQAPRCLASMSS